MILYHGPSRIDGSTIVAIATGMGKRKSKNAKTGPMAQVWILQSDINPVSAIMTGADVGICGDCPHRGPLGKRSCYVNVGKAPNNVWKKWARGGYETCGDLEGLGTGLTIRIGSYGDPAAVPTKVWKRLITSAAGWTGYTHHWRKRPSLKGMLMASVDSLSEAASAVDQGWRTFRVGTGMGTQPNEILCPASEEAGKRTTCTKCQLCTGQQGDGKKSIAIVAHGVGKWRITDVTDIHRA